MKNYRYEFKMIQHDGTEVIVKGDKEIFNDILDDWVQWCLGCGFTQTVLDKYIDWTFNEDFENGN